MKSQITILLNKLCNITGLICISLLTIQVYPTQSVASQAGVELYQYQVNFQTSNADLLLTDFGARYYFGKSLCKLGDLTFGVEGAIRARPIAPIKKTDVRYRGLDMMGGATYDLNPSLQLYGKLGLVYEKMSAFMPAGNTHIYETTRNTSPEIKVGGSLKFNQFGIGVSLNRSLLNNPHTKPLNRPHKNNNNMYSALTLS